MRKELPKQYDPTQVESQIYQMWLDSDCFKAEPDRQKALFHRHAASQRHRPAPHGPRAGLDAAGYPDALQAHGGLQRPVASRYPRWHRHPDQGRGRAARREGKTRYDLGRESSSSASGRGRKVHGSRIVEQQRKLGVSCDWSRSRFTMDEGCSKPCVRPLVRCMTRGLFTRAAASSTGACTA